MPPSRSVGWPNPKRSAASSPSSPAPAPATSPPPPSSSTAASCTPAPASDATDAGTIDALGRRLPPAAGKGSVLRHPLGEDDAAGGLDEGEVGEGLWEVAEVEAGVDV